MADVKISALPAATTVAATDVAPIVAGGTVTQQASMTQMTAAGLPTQTGQSGKVLSTNGTALSWASMPTSLTGVTKTATPFTTALGAGANTTTTGVENTFLGHNAGLGVTTGANNTFLGSQSGTAHTAGNNNTAVGCNTATSAGGNNNTVVGYQAGAGINVGNSNTFMGANCGDQATSADSCTALGEGALGAIAVSTGATAVGAKALAALTNGTSNTSVGYYSSYTLTTGDNNTAVGFNALRTNATASNNTAIGQNALYAATGGNNTAIGAGAGDVISTGVGSVVVGYNAGGGLTTGGGNTFVGTAAGSIVTTGTNNTIIGQYNGDSATMSNNFIASDGAGNRKLQVSNTGAFAVNGGGYGSDGMVMKSNGVGAAAAWEYQNVGRVLSTGATMSLGLDITVYFANCTNGSITLTLPAASASEGGQITVKRKDNVIANTLTMASAGGQIEGLATTTIGPGMAVTYCSDGSDWWELANS